ncbi:hypothetical protein N7491_002073 [Penicillium cf. griseofulvum]|uniref:Uncharacterized protein n=1 Tax=Penicillium cf. griseofulvum TaxID=2972120 RepID=A0A9W9MTL3_9EURO|nr:hypothetical protein N7472_003743 [Penicillium cf. griseofulvum]KAJ5445991.1 hypothetical protein N7491_002073 [Penicillium cf. griseofulvum]KAJ5447733.1 hypothetical protein N7445_002554 [Penicillium cf. griseofulvum]
MSTSIQPRLRRWLCTMSPIGVTGFGAGPCGLGCSGSHSRAPTCRIWRVITRRIKRLKLELEGHNALVHTYRDLVKKLKTENHGLRLWLDQARSEMKRHSKTATAAKNWGPIPTETEIPAYINLTTDSEGEDE